MFNRTLMTHGPGEAPPSAGEGPGPFPPLTEIRWHPAGDDVRLPTVPGTCRRSRPAASSEEAA